MNSVAVAGSTSVAEHARSWSVPFTASAVRGCRSRVTDELRRSAVRQRTIDDARLVVSELLGNALRHARPLADGRLAVTLEVEADTVRLAVSDGGSATLPMLINAPEMALGGRGLSIVGTLTREWGVQEARSGNTVYGVLPRA